MSKKILLACQFGMSTSMLVKKMQDTAKSQSIDVEITALSINDGIKKIHDFDVVLLGPQIRFNKGKFDAASEGKVPVQVIDMRKYGAIDGAGVLEDALKLIHKGE